MKTVQKNKIALCVLIYFLAGFFATKVGYEAFTKQSIEPQKYSGMRLK